MKADCSGSIVTQQQSETGSDDDTRLLSTFSCTLPTRCKHKEHHFLNPWVTRLQKEIAAERAEKAKIQAKKDALRKQLEAQLEVALARKLKAEPAMTQTEREINADMLRRMRAAEAANPPAPIAV